MTNNKKPNQGSKIIGVTGAKGLTRPIFAYGVFKKGQVSYPLIEEYIIDETPARIPLRLKQRNGVPMAVYEGDEYWVDGLIYTFDTRNGTGKGTDAYKAYEQIGKSRRMGLYRWETVETEDGKKVNTLIGNSPSLAEPYLNPREYYDGREDIGFTQYDIEYIKNRTDSLSRRRDLYDLNQTLFEEEMTYMLIWSLIDKFLSLSYGGHNQGDHVGELAKTPYFREALRTHVPHKTEYILHDTQLDRSFNLNPENPKESMNYYYRLRCNITHGGKHNPQSIEQLSTASYQLIRIIEDILNYIFDKRDEDLKKYEY